MSSIDFRNIKPYLFFLLILSTELIQNFNAVDKIGPQWLYLSIVVFLGFLTLNKVNLNEIKNKTLLFYTSFIFISLISIFIASNKVESLVYISRIILIYLCFLYFLLTVHKIKQSFILNSLFILYTIEGMSIFFQFIELFNFGESFGRNSSLIGVSANINIAGFSLALLTPFAILFMTKKKGLSKYISLLIICISSFSILLTGSRGATLSLSLVIISYLIHTFIFNNSIKEKVKISIFILIPFCVSVLFSEILFDGLNYSNRIEQIITRGSSSRFQYYNDAINSFIEKPFLGVGIGNWKLNSIEFGKRHIEGYIVPYHAHNDFLQILAEIGIFGFLCYIAIFINTIFKTASNIFKSQILFSCLLFIGIYLIDSNLNFPIARPIMQIKLALILAILNKNEK